MQLRLMLPGTNRGRVEPMVAPIEEVQEDARGEIEDGIELGQQVEQRPIDKLLPQPTVPAKKELEGHNATHVFFCAWCGPCVDGKTREFQHRRVKGTEEERNARPTVVELDHFFLKDTECAPRHGQPNPDFELTPLDMICKKSGGGGCTRVRQKGSAEPYATVFVEVCGPAGKRSPRSPTRRTRRRTSWRTWRRTGSTPRCRERRRRAARVAWGTRRGATRGRRASAGLSFFALGKRYPPGSRSSWTTASRPG